MALSTEKKHVRSALSLVVISAIVSGVGTFALVKFFGDHLPKIDSDVLAVLLFFASALIGAWVSKYYSERSATSSLRDYAIQVARGVMVMQSHVHNLRDYIIEKRGLSPPSESTIRFDLQLEHVELTLKDLLTQADASLSGIAGIIGEDLKQHGDVLAKINQLQRDAHEESAKLLTSEQGVNSSPVASVASLVDPTVLARKLEDIERLTSERIAALTKSSSLPVFENPTRLQRSVSVPCPTCRHANNLVMTDLPGQTKVTDCPSCGSRFNVHLTAAGFPIARAFSSKVKFGSVRSGWMTWNFPWKANEFSTLEKMVIRVAGATADPLARTPQGLMDMCVESDVVTSIGVAVEPTTKSRFVMILWYGRLFTFASGTAGLGETYSNGAITRADILMAVARYAGHKFGLARAPIDALLASAIIRGVVCADASEDDVSCIKQLAAEAYARVLDAGSRIQYV